MHVLMFQPWCTGLDDQPLALSAHTCICGAQTCYVLDLHHDWSSNLLCKAPSIVWCIHCQVNIVLQMLSLMLQSQCVWCCGAAPGAAASPVSLSSPVDGAADSDCASGGCSWTAGCLRGCCLEGEQAGLHQYLLQPGRSGSPLLPRSAAGCTDASVGSLTLEYGAQATLATSTARPHSCSFGTFCL